tara:strand:+ start:3000 stop:3419 length:420 start_codon:yes stop_codon:yes gene_type:complete
MDNTNMEILIFLIDRYYLTIPLIVVLIMLLISNNYKGGKKISAQSLIKLCNNDEAVLIDLRSSDLFNSGHITSSINIPLSDILKRSNEINNSNKKIILICEMGNSAPNAGEILQKEGFDDLLILKGGINEWRMENLPLV